MLNTGGIMEIAIGLGVFVVVGILSYNSLIWRRNNVEKSFSQIDTI